MVSGIRTYFPSEVNVTHFVCDMMMIDDSGRTLRLQITGVPPEDLTDVWINGQLMHTYSQQEVKPAD